MMGAKAPNPCPFPRDYSNKPNASPAPPPPKSGNNETHVFRYVVEPKPSQAESLLCRMLGAGCEAESYRGDTYCFFCKNYLPESATTIGHETDCPYVAAKAYIETKGKDNP